MTPNDLGHPIASKIWPMPDHVAIAGHYMRLEPLSMDHLDALWHAAKDAPDSFTYLRYGPFQDQSALRDVIVDLSTRSNQPFWAVTPEGGQAAGWLSICDVYQGDASIEIGSIWFAPSLQGTRAARESLFKLMCVAMDDLAYERLVWRCQAQNAKSFQAAIKLGFQHEGTWRRAAIIDSWQRDVAWFSILKDEWADIRAAFEGWLAADNFAPDGTQRQSLSDFRMD